VNRRHRCTTGTRRLRDSGTWVGKRQFRASLVRDQQADHRHLEQRFARLHSPLVILAHASIARYPTGCSLHYPSPRLNAEATLAGGAFYDFEVPTALHFAPVGQLLSDGSRCLPRSWRDAARSLSVRPARSVRPSDIVHIGLRHVDRKWNPQGIHQEVSLTPARRCLWASKPQILTDSSTVFTRMPRPEWLRWDAGFFLAVRARLCEALAARVSRCL
jgi:hypothetical protein